MQPTPIAPEEPSSPHPTSPDLEAEIRGEGEALLDAMEKAPADSFFSRKGAYARLMQWSMSDPAFKTQLFRFVDVLPSLTSATEIVRHLQEYLGPRAGEISPMLKTGLSAAGVLPALVAAPVKAQVAAMAGQFVAGESPQDLLKRFRENVSHGISTTIDLLGEAVVSDAEADSFLERNLEVIQTLGEELRRHPKPCFSDQAPTGTLPRLNLSLKVSALAPDVNPTSPTETMVALKTRLRPILRAAAEQAGFIHFDMESYRYKSLTLSLFLSVLEEDEFQHFPAAGIALQAYLRDAEADLNRVMTWARRRKRPITVRLVKGAYWDYENILAAQRGWPSPVFTYKEETDANFEKLARLLLETDAPVSAAFATHNVRSCAAAIVQARRAGRDPRAYEFQALYGMADDLKHGLVARGYRVREYCPVGELLPGMAYLVRRLLENTSNEGFLRARHVGGATRNQLLAKPTAPGSQKFPAPSGRFRNAPNTDFSNTDEQERMNRALAEARAQTPRTHTLTVLASGPSREKVAARNPAHPQQILGWWTRATVPDAELALSRARAAQAAWARRPAAERIAVVESAARHMETRRFQLAALEVLEAGKPWIEADADVSEAIDFCRFYAEEARQLAKDQLTQAVAGERNIEHFIPRGVGVVIAPWNFPLAILCGMTVAAIITGNAVIMKPAEQTSLTAHAFADILRDSGCPEAVAILLTGTGEEVAAHLVAHPGIDFVAFTGSREVGLKIWETVGRTAPEQRNLKRAVCEMGGKNALIIDSDADWDEAIPAVLYSAFGFSGQKCSALSRLIVHEAIAEPFVKRLVAAASALRMGDPALPSTMVGPLIDAEARAKALRYLEIGKREARLMFEATLPPDVLSSEGHYVPPCIFAEVRPEARIAREEIFGPVLAVLTAKSLDHAFELANDSPYALTAGIFSRSPSALQRARRELIAGNVYLNRGITGALVGRHPFGGFRMSGGGTKAGGADYLKNFVFSRVISENTMRRGFVDEADPAVAGE